MAKKITNQGKNPTTSPQVVSFENGIVREHELETIKNGLGNALLGDSTMNQLSMGVMLSQANTLFKNNRWYLVSNMRQLLSQIYVEHGIVQTVVDVPVNDGLRGGVTFKSKQLDDDQVHELQVKMRRENDINTMGQALKWNRLFGGAGVLIITDQKADTPLELDNIREDSPLEFVAVDMWELFYDKQNTDEAYTEINLSKDSEFYNYYGKKVHKSRVLKLKGLEAPSFVRPRLRGWGFSVVEGVVRSINQYLKTTDLTFEVLDEFKLDIFKIKNLSNTLIQKGGDEKIRQRVAIANQQKNYQNAMTMDSEDDYVQKQLSFAGIAEVMVGIKQQVAGDLRFPLTKLFGVSAAGFSSGEDDIENYNAMVESSVRTPSEFHLLKMAEIRCQQLFGFVPDDLELEFKPLRILSATQEEDVKDKKFNRLMAARDKGYISQSQFNDGVNKENLLPVALDATSDSLTPDDAEEDKIPTTAAKKSSITAPAAPEPKE